MCREREGTAAQSIFGVPLDVKTDLEEPIKECRCIAYWSIAAPTGKGFQWQMMDVIRFNQFLNKLNFEPGRAHLSFHRAKVKRGAVTSGEMKDMTDSQDAATAEALTLALLDRDTLQAALDCAQLEKEELQWRLDELKNGFYDGPAKSNLIGLIFYNSSRFEGSLNAHSGS